MAVDKPICDVEGFVNLVEEMRKAQVKYFDMATSRDANFTQHQMRRALQDAKTFERRVDDWIAQNRAETARWKKWVGEKKTDELPGFYGVQEHGAEHG